jgi:hypothetical protein
MKWIDTQKSVARSLLEPDEVLSDSPAWSLEPYVTLWLAEHPPTHSRQWVIVGSYPMSRDEAIAKGRSWDLVLEDTSSPGKGESEAEVLGRMPTLLFRGDVVPGETASAAVHRMASSAKERHGRPRESNGTLPDVKRAAIAVLRELDQRGTEFLLQSTSEDTAT